MSWLVRLPFLAAWSIFLPFWMLSTFRVCRPCLAALSELAGPIFMQVAAGVSSYGLVMGCHCHCCSFCLLPMPTLLFGRHVATEFPSGFNFVTSTFPGCFAGMLLGLRSFSCSHWSFWLVVQCYMKVLCCWLSQLPHWFAGDCIVKCWGLINGFLSPACNLLLAGFDIFVQGAYSLFGCIYLLKGACSLWYMSVYLTCWFPALFHFWSI